MPIWNRRLARSEGKGILRRSRARALPATLALTLLASCGGGDSRLLIVTSNDVSGKTSPCGCHTPKGGLARRAAFLDSVRSKRANVLVLDAGNFFPATDDEREAAPFMLAEMAMEVDADNLLDLRGEAAIAQLQGRDVHRDAHRRQVALVRRLQRLPAVDERAQHAPVDAAVPLRFDDAR